MEVLCIDDEGAQVLHDYLWIRQLRVASGDEVTIASLLGVECEVQIVQPAGSAGPLILCARPGSEPWALGDCFPLMPGVTPLVAGAWERTPITGFYLRFMALADPLWVFIYRGSRNLAASEADLAAHIQEMALFKDWLGERSFDDLGFSLEGNGTRSNVAGAAPTRVRGDNGALMMWGRLKPAVSTDLELGWLPALGDFLDHAALGSSLEAFPAKAHVSYGDGSPELVVQLPPIGHDFGEETFCFKHAAIYLASPITFAPFGSMVGVQGDFVFKDKRIHIDLDYPIDGDIIRATGKYIGGPEHLMGESASFGLPGPAPSFGSDTEVLLELEFSKSSKTLTKLKFDLELREKDWMLLPAPVQLKLEGVSFQVVVFDPLGSNRVVMAQIAAEAAFGDDSNGSEPVRHVCGGSYPRGDLYLQARNSIPIGNLLEKLIGPSPGLEKFTIDNLRLEFNYRSKHLALQFDVPEKWPIVDGFEVGDLQFRIQGSDSYSGGLAATLKIADIDVYLSALYDQGWQFEGSTGQGQAIPIGKLLIELGEMFGMDADHPACLEGLAFKNLHVYFNSATKDFSFEGEADFDVQGTPVSIEVSIDITHQIAITPQNDAEDKRDTKDNSVGLAQKRLGGVIKFGDHEFEVVFADEKIVLKGSEVEVSTLVAAYRSTGGDPPGIRDLVPAVYKSSMPNITTRRVFLAGQWQKPAAGDKSSKWLLGLCLEAGLDLSNVKLPDLPLMGSGGPPKSLKLDIQVLVATEKFEESELGIIGKLNATGGVSVPTQAVDGVALATTLFMDGRTVKLNLPIQANPNPTDGQAAFSTAPAGVASAADPAVSVAPADGTKWVQIQKNFGPIHIERVGLKYKEEKLFIFLDGGLTAAGFTVSLEGLGVDTPLTEFDPHFHLNGIGLDYRGGAVELGGSFLQQQMHDPVTGETYTSYAGEAVLRTEQLTLAAVGSYMKYRGETSLFVYALLDYPLGGPPFFFVTGLAAGFGYNRRAIIPPVEQVHTYPLVSKAIAGPPVRTDAGTADGSTEVFKPNLAAELAALEAYLPAELGEVFLAVGVKFTSFEMIDSFGLVIAQFGVHNQFDLVGVSHLQIPSKEAGGQPGSLLAEIYMNWKAVFRPDEGVVGLKAVLAPGSYVFSNDCHLTGGFAYYAWFGGEHAGDFVYTVGGYHPDFHKPDHYPVVPRLAFNWIIPQANLHLKGELYYALTGHAFMAGGRLDASIHGGFDIGIAGVDYYADLHIAADFLITWEPYHYDAAVSLDLNIDLSAHLFFYSVSFSLNVGGDMHIWGPDFAGEARIYLKVWKISHSLDIKFGAGRPMLRPITWEKFHRAFLPKINKIPDGYDLVLVSVDKEEAIPAQGLNEIFIAKVIAGETHQIHFRIFDAAGQKVVDKPQSEMPDRTAEIDALNTRLDDLWNTKREFEAREKAEVITAVTSILRYPRPDPHAICGVSVKRGLIRSSGDRWIINAKEFCLVTDSMIPSSRARRGETPLVTGDQFRDSGEEGKPETDEKIATDFGIAAMGVHSGEIETVHSITIKRDRTEPAEEFFRCEPVFKKVPAAMWDEPRFTDATEEFLDKPELNPQRQLVAKALGGMQVLPAVLVHPSETQPVDRRELQYATDRLADAWRWASIPTFKAEEQDATWGRSQLNNTIVIKTPWLTPQVDHMARNLDLPVAEDKGFFFRIDGLLSGHKAHSLKEFITFLEALPIAAHVHHLRQHDFSKWIAGVFGDLPMAKCIRDLEDAYSAGRLPDVIARIVEAIRSQGDVTVDAAPPWKVRERILNELGLDREEIYFGQPADQYMLDAPLIAAV